jgi:ribosomal protein L14E/L6E/L27E
MEKNQEISTIEEKVFDLEDCFTLDAEQEGVFFRPVIQSGYVPFQIKTIGRNSDRMLVITDKLKKRLAEISGDAPSEARAIKERDAYVASAVERTTGIKFDEGVKIKLGGKDFEYTEQMLKMIYTKSPDIMNQVILHSASTEDFYRKKD